MNEGLFDFVFLGAIRQDYIITYEGKFHSAVLGGNAAFAAAGAKVWSSSIGIISRVGYDFPSRELDRLCEVGINLNSIRILPDTKNQINFYAYTSPEVRVDTNPTPHFLRIGKTLPKELINAHSATQGEEARDHYLPLSIRPSDIPFQSARCRSAHLSPAQFLTHLTVPVGLREMGIRLITLAPSERYMEPSFYEDLPLVVNGLDAFLPSEKAASGFFQPLRPDRWEMAEAFGAMGSGIVVIRSGMKGTCVWDANAKRGWHVPAYPAKIVDLTGVGSAFCGGFLVGLTEKEDPVEAALMGTISASLAAEGPGALFPLGATPGLAMARLESLRSLVKLV